MIIFILVSEKNQNIQLGQRPLPHRTSLKRHWKNCYLCGP